MQDAANAVVFDDNRDNYLLVQRRDVPVWVLPGGGIDPGETPEDAAVREVKEESGLEVEIVRKVAVYTPTGRLSSTVHLFECRILSGTLVRTDETLDAAFYPVGTYPPPVFPIHDGWVRDTCRNEPDVIEKPIEGLEWWSIAWMFFGHPILACRYLLTKVGIHWNSRQAGTDAR